MNHETKRELKLSVVALLVLMGLAFGGISLAKREDKGDFTDSMIRQKLMFAGWPEGKSITVASIFGDLDDGVTLTKQDDWYIASATNISVYSDRPANALGSLWILTRP